MKRAHQAKWIAGAIFGVLLTVGYPASAAQGDLEDRVAKLEIALVEFKAREQIVEGREIYKAACMACHGIKGDGKGANAKWLDPKPRDFTSGLYKWRTTPYGALPTDEDLERTVTDGISGSEMFPFGTVLSKQAIRAVVQYIKSFSPKFSDPSRPPESEIVIEIPEERPFETSEASIEAGAALFVAKGCIACHGAEGAGDGPAGQALLTAWGHPIKPWDFQRGYYKSGWEDRDLYRTITTGLNGTPMISYLASTTEEERWQLVDFIRSLGSDRDSFFHHLFGAHPGGRVYGEARDREASNRDADQ